MNKKRYVTYDDFIKNGGEEYWQTGWQSSDLYQAEDFAKKKKKYILIEFPYPSGAGLHVGHVRSYTALDIMSRMLRLQGYNVLYPIGWDAFGLPTENYAIKNKIHPRLATEANIKTFRRQLKSLGLSFDWSREVDTTDPKYYQWTQWIFLQLFKKGLAYKKKIPINWCPSCKIGLAHEEVIDGKCERCGTAVEQREKEQWLLAITKYADRLIKDLDPVDYLEKIKTQQVNWIGRSKGAELKFEVRSKKLEKKEYLNVFTTKPDTLFGATYMVLAPEHELVTQLKDQIENWREVEKYINQSKTKSELQRTSLEKAKTGVELEGIKAINPANNEEIPVWIADYVLASYGTGAIMAVPAHDERDFEFAKKFKLPIKQVIAPETGNKRDGENVVQGGCGVVFDPKSQKYAVAAWNNGMIGLFSGNVGKTEDEQAGILREVTEESGLHDFLHIEKIATAYPHYYNSAKNSNRHGSAACYLAVLKTANMRPTKREAHEKFELQWRSPTEILNNWRKYNQKNDLDHWVWFLRQAVGKAIELGYDSTSDNSIFYISAYVGKGVIINSGGFNGLSSDEAKKKITAKVGGKMKVQYKLRDWIFSRQHYWGEPIPMVYCEQCAQRKPKVLLIHGLYGHSKENWLPWFKKQMEKNGYEVLIPDLPNNERPSLAEWLKALGNLGIRKGDQLFIVGHSLGAPTACQFILKNKLRVEKLILVAPTGKSQNENNFANLQKAGCSKEAINCIKDFNDANTGLGKLKKSVENSVVYFSDNDPYIPLDVQNDYRALGAEEKLLRSKGHFNSNAGVVELPEILEEFPSALDFGWIPVPEKDLPVELPKVKHYEPTDTGESPLAVIKDWVNTECPRCGGKAKRETDTMPNWAGSSWYFLRYCDPKNNKAFADAVKLKYWLPVDLYNGGMEHTTLHLLYSRFWNKFLYDCGLVPVSEPYARRVSHGMVLAEDGKKMSKSLGNVINPDEVVNNVGADSLRLYEMFMGPFADTIPWSMEGVKGVRRFLEKVFALTPQPPLPRGEGKRVPASGVRVLLHKTIKKITEDIENMKFNTAVSAMMIFVNEAQAEGLAKDELEKFLIILAPFAPHMTEELWSRLGHKQSIFKEKWPAYDANLTKDEIVRLAIQVNGKLRDTMEAAADISADEAKAKALASEKVKKWTEGKLIAKVIVVKNRLVNIVVK